MKCIDCNWKLFHEDKGGANRYYCNNQNATKDSGSRLIIRTERHSTELKIKTSPKWCPLKNNK